MIVSPGDAAATAALTVGNVAVLQPRPGFVAVPLTAT
jgi:hypothetical protein